MKSYLKPVVTPEGGHKISSRYRWGAYNINRAIRWIKAEKTWLMPMVIGTIVALVIAIYLA
jgi:hypothetical protein